MPVRFYCDESEDKESKVLSLAGFFGVAEDWEQLQEEWIARVKPTGVSAYHMTDCDNNQGEFSPDKGWTKPDCTQLTIDLIEIIAKHNVLLIGSSMLLDDYRSIPPFPGTDKRLGWDEWHFLFQSVFPWAVVCLGADAPPEETIALFFDWREKRGVAYSLFEDITKDKTFGDWPKRIGILTFGHKEFDVPGSIPLLQVADVAAVETHKALANPFTHPHLKERQSLSRLKRDGRVWIMVHHDKLILEAMYEVKKKQYGMPNNAEEAFRKMRTRTISKWLEAGVSKELIEYILRKGIFNM
jgi:hypothetical protein